MAEAFRKIVMDMPWQNAAFTNETRASEPRSIKTLNDGGMATPLTQGSARPSSNTKEQDMHKPHASQGQRVWGASRFAEGTVVSKLGMALICHVVDPAGTDDGVRMQWRGNKT